MPLIILVTNTYALRPKRTASLYLVFSGIMLLLFLVIFTLFSNIYTKNKLQFSYSLFICGGTFFAKNSQRVEIIGCFCGRVPSLFDRTLNAALPKNLLQHRESLKEASHHWGYTRECRTPLPPNSPDLHQNNKMKTCTNRASSFP